MRLLFLLTTLLLSVALSPAAYAVEGAPALIDYQGSVLDDQGNPLAATSPALFKMEFRIWDQIGAGNLIWSEQQTVTVSKGQFSVRLGEGTATTDIIPPKVPQDQLLLAFEGQNRFLGVTVVTNPLLKTEITPRVAFLTTPYAHVANTASRVIQAAGTSSSLILGGVGYATRKDDSGAATINLTLDQRTNLIAAGPAGTTAILPVNGDSHELLISKTDDSTQFVTIAPPAGGQINGAAASIRLKVKGESVTLQNSGGNNWWVVDDTRDNTPVGTITSFGGETPPAGYLPCDGRALSATDYAELNGAIGTLWGAGTFKLPNLTGRFLRGSDTGLAVGTIEADAMKEHPHAIKDKAHGHDSGPGTLTMGVNVRDLEDDSETAGYSLSGLLSEKDVSPTPSMTVSSASTGLTAAAHGGNETRPDNAGVRYCIKY
jgi:microcystin-dependent protein